MFPKNIVTIENVSLVWVVIQYIMVKIILYWTEYERKLKLCSDCELSKTAHILSLLMSYGISFYNSLEDTKVAWDIKSTLPW